MITTASAELDWTQSLLTPLRRAAWRTYLYFLLISVLAVVGIVFIFGTGLASGLLIVTLVGIPLLALVVMSGRAWNRLYRALARLTGAAIDAPPPFVRPQGRLQTVAAALTDAVGWRSLGFLALHAILMTPIGYVVIVSVGASAALVASPVLWLATGETVVSLGAPVDSLWAYILLSVAGVVALYLMGWVMLGISRAHVWLARTLLGPTGRERRVAQLEQARAGVVDDSAATLQRVERDLHDGTQARLITVAMALARADEHLATSNVATARELVSDALANTRDTLTELRDLVRGIRPPALDLGLGPAVQTLAARNPIPVDVTVDLVVRPSIGVETMAYFCVAELLANVSKHSGASQAVVRLSSDANELRIIVQDNGSGGVQVGNGSGLTGLADRRVHARRRRRRQSHAADVHRRGFGGRGVFAPVASGRRGAALLAVGGDQVRHRTSGRPSRGRWLSTQGAQHLSITERAVEKHVSAIFTKLDLAPSQAHHRRVLAVVTYLNS